MECAKRYRVDAIDTENAHDKNRCYERVKQSIGYCKNNYLIFIYFCGLCSTGVPCESKILKILTKNKE